MRIGVVATVILFLANSFSFLQAPAAQEATFARRRHQLIPLADDALLVIGGSTLPHGMSPTDELFFIVSGVDSDLCVILEGPIDSIGYPGRAPSFVNYRDEVMVAGGYDRESRVLVNEGVLRLEANYRWRPVVRQGSFGAAGNPLLFNWRDELMLVVRPSRLPPSDDPRSIWLSDDGVNWRRTGELPEEAIERGGYELTVFGDQLVLRSQVTGIWATSNLRDWRRIETNIDLVWRAGTSMTSVVHQSKLYLIGHPPLNLVSPNSGGVSTVFMTEDLIHWAGLNGPGSDGFLAFMEQPFEPRFSPALHSNGRRIIMHGGLRPSGATSTGGSVVLDDFWVSEDGIRWRELEVCDGTQVPEEKPEPAVDPEKLRALGITGQ